MKVLFVSRRGALTDSRNKLPYMLISSPTYHLLVQPYNHTVFHIGKTAGDYELKLHNNAYQILLVQL